jgi:hypothetical protein
MPNARTAESDAWTVASIAIVVYCLTNVAHEGIGHGGACLLLGGKPILFNAAFFTCGPTGPTETRIIMSAGGILNLMLALIAALGLRLRRGRPGAAHYFFWLLLAVNFLMPSAYLGFSGIGGFGDWAELVKGWQPWWLWRIVLIAISAVLYFWIAPRLLMPGLDLYLGGDREQRILRARRVALFPYLVGGVVFTAAGLLNPYGLAVVLLSSVASSLGGTSWLAYYPTGKDATATSTAAPEPPAVIPRSVGWMIAAACALAIFVGVLGRGFVF